MMERGSMAGGQRGGCFGSQDCGSLEEEINPTKQGGGMWLKGGGGVWLF